MEHFTYETLVRDMLVILKQNARGKPPKISLSTETAALLQSVSARAAGVRVRAEARESDEPVNAARVETEPEPVDIAQSDTGNTVVREESPAGPAAEDTLERIAREVSTCQKCPLCTTRVNAVPGEGDPHASLVFVGEAPGGTEDKQGRPFVGRAGHLLTDIITKGMKLRREDVFICNVLKCRPPDNRTPNPEEVMHCEPYLLRQLALIRPKVICALGAVAAQTLLKTNTPISKLRGLWHDYHGIALRVTYHPAYLLRNPADKAKTWEDVQEIMRYLKG